MAGEDENITVLLVSEDSVASQAIARVLRGHMYRVVCASSPAEAMQELDRADILWTDTAFQQNGVSYRLVVSEWLRLRDGPICVCGTAIDPEAQYELLLEGVDNVLRFPEGERRDLVLNRVGQYAQQIKRDRQIAKLQKDVATLRRYLIAIVAVFLANGVLNAAGIDVIQLLLHLL